MSERDMSLRSRRVQMTRPQGKWRQQQQGALLGLIALLGLFSNTVSK